jgi:hypothetical protein
MVDQSTAMEAKTKSDPSGHLVKLPLDRLCKFVLLDCAVD